VNGIATAVAAGCTFGIALCNVRMRTVTTCSHSLAAAVIPFRLPVHVQLPPELTPTALQCVVQRPCDQSEVKRDTGAASLVLCLQRYNIGCSANQ
jgi:hypothetical protein